jgi:hypothetical protein
MADTETPAKAPKLKYAAIRFVDKAGQEAAHAHAKATGIKIAYSDGEVYERAFADFPKEMQAAAMAYGFSVKLNRSTAGSNEYDDPLGAYKYAIGATDEQLNKGLWNAVVVGGGGRQTNPIILQAIIAAKEAAGHPVDEDAIRTRLAGDDNDPGGKDYRKAARANPAVKAHYDRIELERRQEKAAKSAAAAESQGGAGVADL